MRKPVVKKEKSDRWKKWLPIVFMLLMIVPSFIFFTGMDNSISVNLEARAHGYLLFRETVALAPNTTAIGAIMRYNPQIYDNRIYCMRNLCIDEGNWTFYANGEGIDPFEYFLKDGDNVLMVFE